MSYREYHYGDPYRLPEESRRLAALCHRSPKERRERAEERQARRAEWKDWEQLELLSSRPGESLRERARLRGHI